MPDEKKALDDVNLVLEEGDFCIVIGSNGAGKSSLLNAIAGKLLLDDGKIAIAEGDVFAYGLLDQCMALSMHLFTISTQVPDVPEALSYGTAVVLLGTVLLINALAIILRVYLRSRKKW